MPLGATRRRVPIAVAPFQSRNSSAVPSVRLFVRQTSCPGNSSASAAAAGASSLGGVAGVVVVDTSAAVIDADEVVRGAEQPVRTAAPPVEKMEKTATATMRDAWLERVWLFTRDT
jgi:hypothetical protein